MGAYPRVTSKGKVNLEELFAQLGCSDSPLIKKYGLQDIIMLDDNNRCNKLVKQITQNDFTLNSTILGCGLASIQHFKGTYPFVVEYWLGKKSWAKEFGEMEQVY